jgi:uncharacterized protein YbbC (DUF1343 family)
MKRLIVSLCLFALPVAVHATVKTGADLLVERHLDLLQGHTVGIVTNQTGRLSSGTSLVDTLVSLGIHVAALFGPEHGIRGTNAAGEKVTDGKDPRTGIPVYSLYGKIRKPTPEMLQSVDLLVYDIQDVGARFYTYISTLGLVMEAAAENNIPIIVLDRPNPLGGEKVDGPVLDDSLRSFVGMYPIPVVYGLTCGELARMINGELWLSGNLRARLNVIAMEGWTRTMTWEETGLDWVPPSPNIPDPSTALIYPATCFIEATNLSEGRGTREPFKLIGAPFLSGADAAIEILQYRIPGLSVEEVSFTPNSSKQAQKACHGVHLSVRDPQAFAPTSAGLSILRALMNLAPTAVKLKPSSLKRLLGSASAVAELQQGKSVASIEQSWLRDLSMYKQRSQQYYLYP